jgi:hypothetical protein
MTLFACRLQLKANYFVRLKSVFIIEAFENGHGWRDNIDYRLRNGTIYISGTFYCDHYTTNEGSCDRQAQLCFRHQLKCLRMETKKTP